MYMNAPCLQTGSHHKLCLQEQVFPFACWEVSPMLFRISKRDEKDLECKP